MTPDERCVITMGVFDGVHRGHQALLRRAREIADAHGLPLVVLTFDPHPATVLRPESTPPRLMSLSRRLELLHAHGADQVEVVPFDTAVSQMTDEEFAREYFTRRNHAAAVVVGENLRFGREAAGDVARLNELGTRLGFEGVGVELSRDGVPWSSTRVRAAIDAGDMGTARTILGRDPEMEGTVITGDRRGRELGYPTANVDPDPGLALPTAGIYAGHLVVDDRRLPSAISVGTNPQFEGRELRIEAYVLDRDDLDLYGGRVRLEFRERLRDQAVFPTLQDYLEQMARDVANVRITLTDARGSTPI